MTQRIHIVGGGSAGFMAAMAVKSRLPHAQVTVIRSKEIGIIGVGEGSTPALVRYLHHYIGVPSADFLRVARPTWKLGLKFIWGKRPSFNFTFSDDQLLGRLPGLPLARGAYCEEDMRFEHVTSALMSMDRAFELSPKGEPVISPHLAYHVENQGFVAFLESFATGLGIAVIDDTIVGVDCTDAGVAALRLASGRIETADLYVDASGFKSLLLGRALEEPFISYATSLFCDRAVVGGWERQDAADEMIQPYTVCETMNSGWSWRIDHPERINRGYVYSSAFVTDEEAEREFRAINPKIGPTRVVRFVAGRYERLWVKNVVAVGNAAGFVEPLEATSLGVIDSQARTLAATLQEARGREVTEGVKRAFNAAHATVQDDIRAFLAVHYRFNDRLDTPFWRQCRADVDLAGAAEAVQLYRENGPTVWMEAAIPRGSTYGAAGYVALLQGQRVEHRRVAPPPPAEVARWEAERQANYQRAQRAISVREALRTFGVPAAAVRPV